MLQQLQQRLAEENGSGGSGGWLVASSALVLMLGAALVTVGVMYSRVKVQLAHEVEMNEMNTRLV